MAQFDCMQGLIKGYLVSPQGQQAVHEYFASAQGQAAVDSYLATPGGQQVARLLLARSLDGLDLPNDVKDLVKQAL